MGVWVNSIETTIKVYWNLKLSKWMLGTMFLTVGNDGQVRGEDQNNQYDNRLELTTSV